MNSFNGRAHCSDSGHLRMKLCELTLALARDVAFTPDTVEGTGRVLGSCDEAGSPALSINVLRLGSGSVSAIFPSVPIHRPCLEDLQDPIPIRCLEAVLGGGILETGIFARVLLSDSEISLRAFDGDGRRDVLGGRPMRDSRRNCWVKSARWRKSRFATARKPYRVLL